MHLLTLVLPGVISRAAGPTPITARAASQLVDTEGGIPALSTGSFDGVATGPALKPPELLSAWLQEHPTFSLPDPPVDPGDPGEYSLSDLERLGAWPPWRVADLDGDRRRDVVAVVVDRSKARPLFGVVAIHARGGPHWVVMPDSDVILGVGLDRGGDAPVPFYCLECDVNPWFRWSGRAYEGYLFRPGDDVAIAPDSPVAQSGLLAAARRDAAVVQVVPPCTVARLVRVRSHGKNRWYEVALGDHRGWIPAEWVAVAVGECPIFE